MIAQGAALGKHDPIQSDSPEGAPYWSSHATRRYTVCLPTTTPNSLSTEDFFRVAITGQCAHPCYFQYKEPLPIH